MKANEGSLSGEGQSDLGLLKVAWPHARPDAWAFVLALSLGPVIALLSLAQPWLLRNAIDQHLVPRQAEGLGELGLLIFGAAILTWALQVVYTMSLAWAGARTILRLRQAMARHLLSRSQRFFDQQPTGRLMTRLTSDIESLGDAVTAGAFTIVLDALVVVGVLVAMVWMNPRLTLVTLALSPLLILAIEAMRRGLRRLFVEVREAVAAVNTYLSERIDGVEIIQLYRHEDTAERWFMAHNERVRAAASKSNILESALFSVVDGFSSIVVGALLWVGSGEALRWAGLEVGPADLLTAGTMVAFIDYLDRLFLPLRDASNKLATIQRALASLVKIGALLAVREPTEASAEAAPLGPVRGHIVLRGARFAYTPGGSEVLKGIDLEVRPGEVVALVGPSGSGKTTLTRLLDRSYTGYGGSITLDGRELSSIRLGDLRRTIVSVRQDIQIFSEDIAFNVGLDNPAIDEARRESAAELVHADGFIHTLGWDRVLRERGADLSVGQGQLLTFARAMAHDPAVIILDEATASIDSVTEALVQDAVSAILARKTTIVVAHRLSTVQAADRICFLQEGQLIEQGSHAELMALGGRYAAMVAAGEEGLAG